MSTVTPTTPVSPAGGSGGSAAAPVTVRVSAGTAAKAVGRQVLRALMILVLSLIVLGVLWTVLLQLFDVPRAFGKTPGDVWSYLFSATPEKGVRPTSLTAADARAASFGALGVTLWHALVGFVVGMVVAIGIACAFILLKPIEFAFMPIAMLLRSVPLVAIAPVLLLITGKGTVGIAVIAAIVVLFPALVNMVLGLRSVSPSSLDLIKVNGGSKWMALTKVRLPTSLPYLFASIRISVPGAVVGAMLGEWLSGFTGLGGIISEYKGKANYGGVWTIVALAVIASIVAYLVASVVETAVLAKWGPNAGKTG
ncbi:ABC transporter permease subunit [Nakamurella sp. YIM 132087]|uniref:ABC transporter permease subunit n=1 Tax=Nakamurella alba TaxID=2665158 RepID=A0A7K1FIS1_9ACTN|nr:ABC transporter permease subunit [Nakamurella alba]MTD14021.1 ABC transporter permease subunit [Nakamurella alba]